MLNFAGKSFLKISKTRSRFLSVLAPSLSKVKASRNKVILKILR